MYVKKTEIVICLGSSCFARGNKHIVELIKNYLKENKLEDNVYFHGNHCFGHCQNGPLLKINDHIHTEINEDKVFEILNNHFYL